MPARAVTSSAAAPSTSAADVADPSPQNAPRGGTDAQDGGVAVEIGGRDGPDPTRYGDWEKNGRCIDF